MHLTYQEIEAAHARIHPYITRTDLLESQPLKKLLNYEGRIFLKLENQQNTGSFKVRGAFNRLLTLPQEITKVVAFSSGNFAQAVSYACSKIGKKAFIVMPENAPEIKIQGTQKYGATITFCGKNHGTGPELVKKVIAREGCTEVHPYNDYATMAGQGTASIEIMEQCPTVENFFCPVGGGGLLSGCATALKHLNPRIRIFAVEPWGAHDFYESFQTNTKVVFDKIETIADGLRAPTVGTLNYPILKEKVDQAVTVDEKEIISAIRLLWENHGFKIEPSGAVALAGFIKERNSIKGDVVIMVSGQNVDPERFKEWI
jgi:threonine dehydratase